VRVDFDDTYGDLEYSSDWSSYRLLYSTKCGYGDGFGNEEGGGGGVGGVDNGFDDGLLGGSGNGVGGGGGVGGTSFAGGNVGISGRTRRRGRV
jgi:hypothetical protein